MTRAQDKTDEAQEGEDKAPDEALDVGGEDEGNDVLDFSQVTSYDAVPDGKPYLCNLNKFASGKARSGNKTMTAEFTVDEPLEYVGRKITRVYTLTPNSMFSIFGLLVGMGEDSDKLKGEEAFTLVPEAYLGGPAVVFARDNLYEGRTTSQVNRVAPIGEWDELKKLWDVVEGEGGESDLPF